uniref:Putative GP46 n=1 Tax=Serratia proteamaculans (strain 568) TaxID=399741 RepID=A8GLN4_SERP5
MADTKAKAAQRQREKRRRDREARERLNAGGQRLIKFWVTDEQYAAYERNAGLRRPGKSPYTVAEYAELLFVQDDRSLIQELAKLAKKSCPTCGEVMPGPAGGCWRNGEAACAQTLIWRELALKTIG